MNRGVEGAQKHHHHHQRTKKSPPNTWQMMTLLNPLDALIPKIPFSFFAECWVRVTSRAAESVSVGIGGGGGSIELFLGEEGSSQRAVSTPLQV